jgi:general nucleoside transport system permease protein
VGALVRGRFRDAVLLPAISLLCGFAVAAIAVLLSGANPIEAFVALFQGAFTNRNALPETLIATIPYIFLGLAVAIGFRAGLFNIGAEGQFYLGAIFGVFAGFSVHGVPGIVHIPLGIAAGMLGGFLWGSVPGILKARFGAHEVITTIMLNYVAFLLTDYLINNKGPLADTRASAPKTPFIDPSAQLPILLPGSRLHMGLILALLAVPLVWFLLERTTVGFRIRAVGLNSTAARAAGISVGWTLVTVMGISGALAGLAGADEVLGVSHFMPPSFSVGYGFDSIAVALLARSNPWGILPAAFLFAAMRSGAGFMQLQTQVSADLISIVQATVIMFVAAPLLVRWIFHLREVPAAPVHIAEAGGLAGAAAGTAPASSLEETAS